MVCQRVWTYRDSREFYKKVFKENLGFPNLINVAKIVLLWLCSFHGLSNNSAYWSRQFLINLFFSLVKNNGKIQMRAKFNSKPTTAYLKTPIIRKYWHNCTGLSKFSLWSHVVIEVRREEFSILHAYIRKIPLRKKNT